MSGSLVPSWGVRDGLVTFCDMVVEVVVAVACSVVAGEAWIIRVCDESIKLVE